ncbi:hypothetical protein BDZ89DRAFT_1046346 [Hymenopellis radicata]|nr:hypothetical protein BDZ89DRAFT_1048559 [Hymenopellis radicata]KAF9014674.1 hypothetical protein BDZ89DRAFT_1046346 [Hymenopellis radicata]
MLGVQQVIVVVVLTLIFTPVLVIVLVWELYHPCPAARVILSWDILVGYPSLLVLPSHLRAVLVGRCSCPWLEVGAVALVLVLAVALVMVLALSRYWCHRARPGTGLVGLVLVLVLAHPGTAVVAGPSACCVVARPHAGGVARPGTGVVARAGAGVRPHAGVVARPHAGVVVLVPLALSRSSSSGTKMEIGQRVKSVGFVVIIRDESSLTSVVKAEEISNDAHPIPIMPKFSGVAMKSVVVYLGSGYPSIMVVEDKLLYVLPQAVVK